MLSRLRLVAADLKRAARGLIPAIWGLGLVAAIGAAVYLGDTAAQRVVGGLLISAVWLSIVVLIAVESGRQDRLRARLLRQVQGGSMLSSNSGTTHPAVSSARPLPMPPLPKTVPPNPTVTVVVTVHNEQDYITTCLRSLQAQTWPDWECVIVDDASSDRSLDVVIDVTSDDPRYRILHHTRNRGLAAARNTGLASARGRYVTFLDGDDFLYPSAIESRLQATIEADDEEWVVGAYCGWHSVPEDAELTADAPTVPRRLRVSWFDSIFDAPFIASAPLVKTEAVKRLGGFNESLRTSEDFDFWSRFLRHGYMIDYAHTTGVAYRQKRDSMYRATARLHADVTIGVYGENAKPLPEAEKRVGTPFVFTHSPLEHQASLSTFRRLVVALTGVVALGDSSAIDEARSELDRFYEPWMSRVIDLHQLVTNTASRIESYDTSTRQIRAKELAMRTMTELTRITGGEPPAPPIPAPVMEQRGIELGEVRRIPWSSGVGGDKPVLLLPSAAYHCDEVGPLADELTAAGVPVVFGILDRRWENVRRELMKYPFPVYRIDGDDLDLDQIAGSVRAVMTLNDWGDYKHVVDAANAAGVPTFGKVEGVQDFEDHDVHWKRYPYRAVSHVLAQGRNDVEALADRPSTIVGSSRLERIWLGPPTRSRDPLAVINLNFTYGVLDEARETWISSVIAACRQAAIPYAISMHPAERARLDDPNVSDRPIRHLLTRGTVLVSRFSTVPFEAMARGVPFVYHNPHREKVPTFHDPDGAFPVTEDVPSLVSAFDWAARAIEDYRTTARSFFERQVDVDSEMPSERRTAQLIGEHADRS